MTNAYCNMSAPPRSTVRKEIRTVGGCLVFDLVAVCGAPAKADENARAAWLEAFVRKHGAALEAVPRPTGYLIATALPPGAPLQAGFRLCQDPILTVAVVARLSGGIYIPRRDLRLGAEAVENRHALPAEAFSGTEGNPA